MSSSPKIFRQRKHIVIPGFATAHSHAFQRALRGRTQRKQTTRGSFWSWRDLMYKLVEKLDPESIFNISRFAFVELAMSGVTAIGEFHYVHHNPDGTPYEDRIILADAVIRAAQEAGLRITLIRTAYFRGGHKRNLVPAQRRFCDSSVEQVIDDLEEIEKRFKDDPLVNTAIAAHSIRAVPKEAVVELSQYAKQKSIPFHMHVAEQRKEVEECKAEYGLRPVELLAENDVLDENFVAIHAIHLESHEIQMLGETKSMVCLCRTTERDLGDGLPATSDLIQAGVKICVGVDSHTSTDAFEEIRAVELDDRSRTEARHVVADAPELLKIATQNGFEAIGISSAVNLEQVYLDPRDPSLILCHDNILNDAVVFSATPRAVKEVRIDGKKVVEDGLHIKYDEAVAGFEKSLKRLGLL